jgi:hypothetical protein
MAVNDPKKQEWKWRLLRPRVPGHNLRQDGGCEGPSHFTSSLLPITTYKATTPGFFQTTFISSKSSLTLWNKKLPLNRAQYRGCFLFYSLPPIQKYKFFFVVPKSCAVEGGKGRQVPVLSCLKVMFCKASDSVAAIPRSYGCPMESAAKGGNLHISVFPQLRAICWAWK